MGFFSGSLTFLRLHVVGGAPKRLDQAVIDKLAEHAIGKQKEQRADRVETGWIGGGHILDRDFSLERNVIGDALQFALRIDAPRCPPDLVRAYTQLELDALMRAAKAEQPTRTQKREARDAALRRVDREIREGRFLRMKQAAAIIDSPANAVLFASTAPAIFDLFHPLFHKTFGKRVERLSAGRLAFQLAEAHGAEARVENATPAPFVRHPHGESAPGVFWTQHEPASRDFLGNEFLLWLWWRLDAVGDTIPLSDKSDVAVVMLRSLALECPWAISGKESLLADAPTRLPEARRAVATGKLPRKAGLLINRQGMQFELSLAAETFAVSGAVVQAGDAPEEESADAKAGPLERLQQIRHLCQTLDLFFDAFLRRRLGGAWREDLPAIQAWLKAGSAD